LNIVKATTNLTKCGAERRCSLYWFDLISYLGRSRLTRLCLGTPHTLHYENALDAINAKKHVLCEKPVTSNAAELRSLLAAAKEHGVFFMEALWTRFQPLALEVKKISESGVLGAPLALQADLSDDFQLHSE
jgi:predicted dehydrogenase